MIVFFNADVVELGSLALFVLLLAVAAFFRNKEIHISYRFRSYVLIGFLFVSIPVATINILVDPFGWLRVGLVEPAAVQDRVTHVDRYNALPTPPNVIIVGSSRVQKLDPTQVEETCGLTALNIGISSAVAESYLGVWRFASQANPLDAVIIGLDMDALYPSSDYGWQLIMSPFYNELNPPFRSDVANYFSVMKNYLSRYMLTQSLLAARLDLLDLEPTFPVSFNERGLVFFELDDPLVENGTFELSLPAVIEPFQGVPQLDPQRIDALEAIAQEAANENSRVFIFLTPVYHRYLEASRADENSYYYENYNEVREILDAFAHEYPHLTWYDFLDIQAVGGDPEAFYDQWHYHPVNAQKVLAAILSDLCPA